MTGSTTNRLDFSIDDSLIKGLAVSAQKGNLEATEEIFVRFNPIINRIAMAYSNQFRYLENDESVFFQIVYDSLLSSIRIFNPEKGEFTHLWRTILKWERLRTLKKLSSKTKQNNLNTFYQGDNDPADFFFKAGSSSDTLEDDYLEFFDDMEKSKIIIDYVTDHYSSEDSKLLSLWMNFYSLKEIGSQLNLSEKVVISRLYTIIDNIRLNVKRGTLCLGASI